MSDEEWGEAVTAFVVLRDGASPPDLAAGAASAWRPSRSRSEWTFLDELPRNAAGKVLRDALRRAKCARGAAEALAEALVAVAEDRPHDGCQRERQPRA